MKFLTWSGILFLVAASAHLYACWKGATTLRKITKPLLLPLLALAAWQAGGNFPVLLWVALACDWLGDVFLIGDGSLAFRLGVTFFGAGQLAYAVAMLQGTSGVPISRWILCVAVAFFVGVTTYRRIKPIVPKGALKLVTAYIVVSYLMWMAPLVRLFAGLPGAGFCFVGAQLFVTSDTILAGQMFQKKTNQGHFWVMLTYIAAQALFVVGLTGLYQ